MRRISTIVVIGSLLGLLCLCPGCERARPEKPPDTTHSQLQQRYGEAVAQASEQFKSLTPTEKAFYEGGGRTRQADTLLPCIHVDMTQPEIEALLGRPSDVRTAGEREYWSYTLFYSQALILQFNEHGKLVGVDGYGADKWKKQGGELKGSGTFSGDGRDGFQPFIAISLHCRQR